MPPPSPRPLTLTAADGFSLAATGFEPAAERRRGALLVAPATGAARSYYRHYAAFLAERGFHVLTFDYRGVGDSRPESLRRFPATMRAWAELDTAAALDWLAARNPGQPLLLVGHSFGGQSLGLLPGRERIGAALFVAVQSGYWRHWRGLGRLGMLLVWYAAIPALSRLFGYFPGKRLGLGEDLPAGVAREWAHWGRHPDYLLRDGGEERRRRFAELTLPILTYGFTDDPYAPAAATRALLEFYPRAERTLKLIAPQHAGETRIGHFGFFRERFRESLWPESAEWLEEQAERLRGRRAQKTAAAD